MSTFAQRGFGQVEPNRLSGITYGDIEAQAPAYTDATATTPVPSLENGMFLCVIPDATGKNWLGRISVLPGAAPANAVPMLVFNERKQYDERELYADFVITAESQLDGMIVPRLIGLKPDVDVYTTNTINEASGSLAVGDVLYIGDDGFPSKTAGTNTTFTLIVDKVYTMPDGQEGVKLQIKKQ